MFLKKSYLLPIIFCWNSFFCFSVETLQLNRVGIPTKIQIDQERNDFYQRELKRYVVKVGTTASVLVMMYITYKASEYFKDIDKRLEKVDKRVVNVEKVTEVELQKITTDNFVEKKVTVSSGAGIETMSILAPVKWIAGGIKFGVIGTKNFVTDLGKCIIESCPTFVTGMMLSTLWQQACSRVIEASKLETLSWYIEHHTQTWSLFHDITLACVPYDLHSELLSLQQAQDKAGLCIRSYVDELMELVDSHKKDSVHDGYFEYSCDNLKKGYGQKSFELIELQNYAAPNIAKRKRAIQEGLQAGLLFQPDETGRQNLVDLANLLSEQVQKIIAFTVMHVDKNRSGLSKETIARGEKRIAQMIDMMNRYLDQMEQLLNMNGLELEGMSIANKGMFTCTYEFERLFREQVNILHRYCSLIS